ncbi:MAG: amino acid adenylation domain-containing protein [Anaerovoracaceae bacterium]|nr:amino acid adenylation domain-containing protein [Bacillota bacterium]MDD7735032.1 amino acid adenylation domain-containing protein [Bacillota bacterium]MDY5906019.1 amino acid adenylation domain-containing protein [Anaerovoracaceae bacterium]
MIQRNVLEYLEATAERLPDKTAFADDKESLTFAQLLKMARSLGTYIMKKTDRRRAPVIVMTDRTAVSIAAFMGVLCSGNFYVPMDNKMPVARMVSIAEQLKPAAIVFAEKDRKTAERLAAEMFKMPEAAENKAAENEAAPAPQLIAMADGFECEEDDRALGARRAGCIDTDPVYAIFTSGSTGKPKGIVISHRSVIDFTEWFTEAGQFTDKDIMGNQAPFYFDLSVKDVYTTLKCGATSYIIPKKLFMFPVLLMEFLEEKKVTALVWATSAFHLVANSGVLEEKNISTLRTAMLGGEALYAKQLNRWRRAMPDVRYVNLYGPTEVTVDCTWYPIEREFDDSEVIPVGKACANKEVFLLNDEHRQCEPCEPGEICVRGSGLARGYFGEWEKTKASFIQDPRNHDYPEIVYCTGDIAVEDENGDLRFVSRKDGQIKHMGYRIELGEIETTLSGLAGLDEIACVFNAATDRIICVFTGAIDDKELAKSARAMLPKYMIPNIYKKSDAMPHNANGKIDRPQLKRIYVENA